MRHLRSCLPSVTAFVVCLTAAAVGSPARADLFSRDRDSLLLGVNTIIAPGALPGGVVAFKEKAFPVIVEPAGGTRVPVVAAARFGKGRAIVVGHGGFFSPGSLKHPDNKRLMANLIAWVSGGRTGGVTVGRIGRDDDAPLEGVKTKSLTVAGMEHDLQGIDVLWLGQSTLDGNPKAQQAVCDFVYHGGGLVVFGPAWGWQQLNPNKDLTVDQSGNQILYPMGLAFGDDMVAIPRGGYPVHAGDATDSLLNADTALTRYTETVEDSAKLSRDDLATITRTISRTVAALPPCQFTTQVSKLCAQHAGDAIPTREKPITNAMPFARLKCILDGQAARGAHSGPLKANPAAADFPGAVPANASRVRTTVPVDTRVPEWHSTGLYAVPGDTITVTLPASAKGLSLRIGAHKDQLWNLPKWERFPQITVEKPIRGTTLRLASAFGGPVYIVVPRGSKLGTVDVTIDGAVAAPYFVRGKTRLADWKTTIRNAPGPWAELQGNRCILTVPSSVVRALDDPDALMTYWDDVMDAAADLYARPRERERPERYCTDRQISAGYMHSGYPIMTWLDVAPRFVDLAILRGKDGGPNWGFYHELGHNHQVSDWTWDGCGEVTNNLFSLYGGETFNDAYAGGDYFHAHGAVNPANRAEAVRKYVEGGANYETWKSNPFLALAFFIDLRRAFGWKAFTDVFAGYRKLSPGEHPVTDQDKRDQFMVRFSREVGKNLGPYFTAWGVPTSETARKSIADLPAWMPPDFPAHTAKNARATVYTGKESTGE